MTFDVEMRSSDLSLVKGVWRTHSATGGTFVSTAVSEWEMVVTRQKNILTMSVRGPETRAMPAPIPDDAEIFGVVFKHSVFMPQFPKSNLVNTGISLGESGRSSFQFLGATWQFPTFENSDTFVSRLLRAGIISNDSIIYDALHGQIQYLSKRSLQRRFLHVTGLAYKTIQQIERAHQATLLLKSGLPISEVAYEAGYFDQAHLTNSLKRFYGQTSAQILQSNKPT